MNCLTHIYKASYLLKYVPNAWLDVRVVFIPKPGKTDYTIPRSFRPITLMNFMYKILEKVLLWDNEEHVLKFKPLHDNQHGFRKGRSCDSALTSLVSRIESSFIDKGLGFTLCAFLDFTGAYDNLTNRSMLNALRTRGCREEFIGWIFDFLKHRVINTSLRGISMRCFPTKGAPQGAVTSPWLWNDVDDGFLSMFDEDPEIFTEGYADDCVLVITGSDPLHMRNRLQQAMNKAQEWAGRQGLEFSGSKTQVVLFTRKQKKSYKIPPKLAFGATEIPFSEVTRHLGVWLDNKLSFRYHLDLKIKKCKYVVNRLSGAMGKFWGISPQMAMWAWKGIARPMLTFGALVWAKVCRFKTTREKLQTLQRQSMKSLSYFRKSTPSLGLETMTNTTPLDLHILNVAAQALIRTKGHEKFTVMQLLTEVEALKGHRQFIDEYLFEMGFDRVETQLDDIPREFCWNKRYTVDKSSMSKEAKKMYGVPKGDTPVAIYTDGSKIGALAGCGIAPFKAKNVVDGKLTGKAKEVPCGSSRDWNSCHLGDVSVFQAEMYAIFRTAAYIIEHAETQALMGTEIAIYSDSQAVVHALCQYETNSHLLLTTIQALNEAAKATRSMLIIRWCKGHAGHDGNERADFYAKDGAEDTDQMVDDPPLATYSNLKSEIKELIWENWNTRWRDHCPIEARCRQTKAFFPELNRRLANSFIQSDRTTLSKLILLVSGHNFLNYHKNIIDNQLVELGLKNEDEVQSAKCDFCYIEGQEEEFRPVQTTIHLFSDCEKFANARLRNFGEPFMEPPFDLTKNQILKFIWDIQLDVLPMMDIEKEQRLNQLLLERRAKRRKT